MRLRLLTAAALTGVLALTGCGGGEQLVEEEPTSAASGSAPEGDAPGAVVPSDLASLVDEYNKSAPPVTDASAEAPPETVKLGADVGWPQCPEGVGIPEKQGQGQPMPDADSEFVIIGLTNSPSFTRNPCIEEQVAWAQERDLWIGAYSVVSFPRQEEIEEYGGTGPWDGSSDLGALRNVGYAAARYNAATLRKLRLDVPLVWIDVEPVPKFDWSEDKAANAAVIVGMARGYRETGYRIGAYSLPSMWSAIAGDLRLYAPEWRPAGDRGQGEAESRCGEGWSFQGGNAVLVQWVEDGRDHNVPCPGVELEPERWFFRY
ncbi:hypothetical protein [Nocardioides daejeonensis]|uniref:hypothetical protein n=1 Tax=Nocardioides daejeonensis TaxID=1046556 RepID=UPI000D740BAF|nr:hypothetical protein [Nocardioides daejeonensis]